MPMWLRKFTWNRMVSHHNEKNAAEKKANTSANDIDMANPNKNKIPGQTISPPSYVTKASRKK